MHRPTIDLLCRKIEVLAYMPSVEVNLGMADPGGWSLTKCGIGFMPLYDPLRTPEKISEFL